MAKPAKTGRNEPCPCGSGKKYKQCCEGKTAERTTVLTTWIAVVVGILVLLVAAGTIASFFRGDRGNESPGRVWSPEHGHWHDVGGGGPRSAARSVPRAARPLAAF